MNKHTCNHVWMACIHFIHFFVDNRSERSFACECIWVCMQTERHNKTPFLFSVSMSLLLLLHTGQAKKKERCRENLRERMRVCSCWYTTWAWPSCMCLGNRNECEKNVLRVKAFAWEEMLFIGIQMEDQIWCPAFAWTCKLSDIIRANTLPLSVSLENSRTQMHTHAQLHIHTLIYAKFSHKRTHMHKNTQNHAHLHAEPQTHINTQTQLHTCTFTLECWHYHLHPVSLLLALSLWNYMLKRKNIRSRTRTLT